MPMFPIFLTHSTVVGLAVLAVLILVAVKIRCYSSFAWSRVFLLALVGVALTLGIGHGWLIASAKEVGVDWSPDETRKVVIYRLPYSSRTPGSGSDAPGFAKVFNESGQCLAWIKLEMIQQAEVNWYDDGVEVGSASVKFR